MAVRKQGLVNYVLRAKVLVLASNFGASCLRHIRWDHTNILLQQAILFGALQHVQAQR